MQPRRHKEDGFALLTTLMLMVLGFGIVSTLLYMITHSTKTTRLGQAYTTALAAAKGGADLIINMMENELFTPPSLAGAAGASSDCLEEKLTQATLDDNGTTNWRSCSDNSTNWDPVTHPDLTVTLANHQVFVKIIHTTKTNTNFFYLVNVRAQLPDRREHVEISFLYQVPLPET